MRQVEKNGGLARGDRTTWAFSPASSATPHRYHVSIGAGHGRFHADDSSNSTQNSQSQETHTCIISCLQLSSARTFLVFIFVISHTVYQV